MSSFTENGLTKKLQELNSSQQSIQTLSLWLIHHRKHHSLVFHTWENELKKAPPQKKLTYMYLANDVIQNSKKKGPEYGKEFEGNLSKVFKHIANTCKDTKTITSLNRILSIWEERGVYDEKRIKEYYKELNSGEGARDAVVTVVDKDKEKVKEKEKEKEREKNKRKAEDTSDVNVKKHKPVISAAIKEATSAAKEKLKQKAKSETIEINGTVETHVTLSPHVPESDPPEPEELIKIIQELENSASSDATVRERIANLPPEVSEISALNKLEDKEAAMRLAVKVNEAIKILNDYNARLANEMNDRKKLTTMLRDFTREQQELLAQAEQRLEEYQSKLHKIKDVQKEVKKHMNNLPDLTCLPDVTGGLAPLPSVQLLFNKN